AQYERLAADLQATRALADELANRFKEVSVMENAGALNFTVLERPKVSNVPSSPYPPQVFGLGFVLGALLGVGGAFLAEMRDQRMRSAEEIKAVLGLPLLGVVPGMPGNLAPTARGMRTFLEPGSDVSEAYRTVRTAVYF